MVFKTLTLYSSHKHRKWPVFTEEARVGYGKIKKIYAFMQKAMHKLSEKPGLLNPSGKNTYTSASGHSLNTAN